MAQIKVICRVRPLNKNENSKIILSFLGDGKSSVCLSSGEKFKFDDVFPPKSSQSDIYEKVGKPIVKNVLSGYNGTIFAYGHTGTGKTYTMEGLLKNTEKEGLIPRVVRDVFNQTKEIDNNCEFQFKVSYFEIYLETIRDLLNVSNKNLSVHEDRMKVPFVKGVTERSVSKPEEVLNIIEEGKKKRHVAMTNMNEHSSRSHSVFIIHIKQNNLEIQQKLHGKLYLVDLAGSETMQKTGSQDIIFKEKKKINSSLFSLERVVSALLNNDAHIPYRESILTRILKESLGGNARTTMIICCSPAEVCLSETRRTLMFGVRVKTIKNCVQINEEVLPDEGQRKFVKEKNKTKILEKEKEEMKFKLKTLKKCDVERGEKVNELEIENKDLNKLVESMQTEKIQCRKESLQKQILLEEMARKEEENRRKEFETKTQMLVNSVTKELSEENKKFTEMLMEIMHQVTEMSHLVNEDCEEVEIDSSMDIYDIVQQRLSKVKTDIENQSIRLTSTEEERNSLRDNLNCLTNKLSEMHDNNKKLEELKSEIKNQNSYKIITNWTISIFCMLLIFFFGFFVFKENKHEERQLQEQEEYLVNIMGFIFKYINKDQPAHPPPT